MILFGYYPETNETEENYHGLTTTCTLTYQYVQAYILSFHLLLWETTSILSQTLHSCTRSSFFITVVQGHCSSNSPLSPLLLSFSLPNWIPPCCFLSHLRETNKNNLFIPFLSAATVPLPNSPLQQNFS